MCCIEPGGHETGFADQSSITDIQRPRRAGDIPTRLREIYEYHLVYLLPCKHACGCLKHHCIVAKLIRCDPRWAPPVLTTFGSNEFGNEHPFINAILLEQVLHRMAPPSPVVEQTGLKDPVSAYTADRYTESRTRQCRRPQRDELVKSYPGK